jgi:hypothetical protein
VEGNISVATNIFPRPARWRTSESADILKGKVLGREAEQSGIF